MILLEWGFGQDDIQSSLLASAWELIAVAIEFRSYVPDLSAKGNLVLLFYFSELFYATWLCAEGSEMYSSYQHTSSFCLQEVLSIKALKSS